MRLNNALVRIYTADSLSGWPGEELFVKQVEVTKRNLYKEKVVIDLSSDHIEFAGDKAFYISLGWPPDQNYKSDFTLITLFENENGTVCQRSIRSTEYQWFTMTLKDPEGTGRVTVGLSLAVEMEVRRYK